ncbi:SOUL family heme-binding protein [Methylobacterium oryzisoli]|uniref:SOUL family heme-binding protein n=1 Tax=Methylobacterium oryzisoli TaxID=3385502 RepID=UPI0038915177
MGKIGYYLVTAAESVLSAVGIRATYEQPRYAVVRRLPGGVEIRDYAPRAVVETAADGPGDAEAFRRLFRYITGANRAARLIAMTVPVEQTGRLIAMTAPVEAGAGVMRFVLPRRVAEAGAPVPTDPLVRIALVPAQRLAALRFSGRPTPAARRAREAELLGALAQAGLAPAGAVAFLGYDPPVTVPFLRRNEVVVAVAE